MPETLAPEAEKLTKPVTPDVERRFVQFSNGEIRATGNTLTFEGMAAVFDKRSEDLGGFHEYIQRGSFKPALRDPALDVRFLINHEGLPLARSTVKEGPGSLQLEERGEGLHVLSEFVPTGVARDLDLLIEHRVVDQMSFSFTMRNGGQDVWNDDYTERTITRFGGLADVSVVTFAAYPQTSAGMRSLVAGVEIIDQDGAVQTDLLDVLAKRIHRGTMFATVEERGRMDAAFAQQGRLSPWMAELARTALGSELRDTAHSEEAEGAHDQAAPMGHWRVAARKRRQHLRQLTH